jgi:cob(I)alamin adenosyltransferase
VQSRKTKIYTKTGDEGSTALVTGKRVGKENQRLSAYGTLDELNAAIGILQSLLTAEVGIANQSSTKDKSEIQNDLRWIQNVLFNIGSQLACDNESLLKQLPPVKDSHVLALEERIDQWEQSLHPLTQFILPGGVLFAAQAHMARTICRRGEREVISLHREFPQPNLILKYLNRLSDYLFVLSRYFNHICQAREVTWDKDI